MTYDELQASLASQGAAITAETGNPASAEASAITRGSGGASETAAGAVTGKELFIACCLAKSRSREDAEFDWANWEGDFMTQAQWQVAAESLAATPPAATQVPSDEEIEEAWDAELAAEPETFESSYLYLVAHDYFKAGYKRRHSAATQGDKEQA
jgi:hypothetical protein